ncbi:hypothetical protein ACF1E9_09965 [Streptomyces roseolus]|uniref:hypothetical protein n=1 Tax=Streptomyces roseolus TaxID=67358 RepID=UPI0036F8C252
MDTKESALSAAQLLETAHQAVQQGFPCDDRLARAALHLIECATDVVVRLPERDLDAAREALNLARAAVVTATTAVREVHDRERTAGLQEESPVEPVIPPGNARVFCGIDR